MIAPPPVTGAQVLDAMKAAKITRVEHHDCAMCGYMTAYFREGDNLYFDAGCDCSSRTHIRSATPEDAADWINMQTDPAAGQELRKCFGLFPAPTGATEP